MMRTPSVQANFSVQANLDRGGVAYALGCYLSWGLVPLYWRMLKAVPAPEVLAHRVVWSALLFLFFVSLRPVSRRAFGQVLQKPSSWPVLVSSAILISLNWGIYIHAVTSGQVLESALGYFINPLVNVALGRLFLGERLGTSRKVAVVLAGLGVAQMVVNAGRVPWIALSLASSFGLYGLVRKKSPWDALTASSLEALLLVPVALAFLEWGGPGLLSRPQAELGLLVLGGAVTALPLFWFVQAARRLPLSALGFFQYLAPLLQFTLAVAVFREPLAPEIARGFLLVWLALGVFSWELFRGRKSLKKAFDTQRHHR
jgi:chloramphenicol-sensitive protein RarD